MAKSTYLRRKPISRMDFTIFIKTTAGLLAVLLVVAILQHNFALALLQQHPMNGIIGIATDRSKNESELIVNGTSLGPTYGNHLHIIKFLDHDAKNNVSYVSIEPISTSNIHTPRIDLRYQSNNLRHVTIDERTPNNTVVAAVVVNDEDKGPSGQTTLTIEHGNELEHFKLVRTSITNTIQVNGAPLSKQRVPEYNLTLMARDHGMPPKWSTTNLVIKLNTSMASLGTNAPLEPLPSLKPPVTDYMYVGLMLVVIFSALIFLIIIGCALVQRPKAKKSPPPRTTSAAHSRLHPSDHCLCFGLTNL